ncbi:MAG: glycoside hydrolase family 36 N-terminal domain-containing protein, partial [Terracidiphilus sp.]
MYRIIFSALLLLFTSVVAEAQSSATFDESTKVFRLDGGNVTYAFGVNARGELQQLYWGGHLGATDRIPQAVPAREWASFDSSYTNTPQEYAGWGAGLFVEPALKVTFGDGNRDLVLHYVRHETTSDGFNVVLKDINRQVFVTLHYAIDSGSGILARSATIENREPQPIAIEQAAAAAWALPSAHYTLNYLTGRWAGEWTLTQEPLHPGARVIESRRGSTGHQANPWFAIEAGDHPDENSGEVWFGALAWSGSWRITVEQDQLDEVRVTGGFNPFDFGYVLQPGQSLESPVFYGGYSANGLGGASRILHHYEIAH